MLETLWLLYFTAHQYTAYFKIYMHTCVLARLTHTALQKTAVCNFGVCTWASEHMTCTRDTHHKFAFYVPHYMCGAATGTVALGNKMQLFCS